MTKDHIKLEHTDETQRQLILPVGEGDFARFIGSLLGKPQTIEAIYEGPFELEVREIENCFHIVDQRVKQQNQATLVQFAVRIVYEDNSSVFLHSLEEFLAYREVRPVTSVAAHLSWTYLIKFQDKSAPERQTIELSIAADGRARYDDSPSLLLAFVLARRALSRRGPAFFLRISHTARSWGTDIENLLGGQIKSWIKQEAGIKRFINEYPGWIGFGLGLLFFLSVIYGIFSSMMPGVESFEAAARRVVSGSMEEKLTFLIQAQANNPRLHSSLWTFVGIAFSFPAALILGVVVSELADNPPRSYLVLSEKSRKAREQHLRERIWTWRYFIGSLIASTIAGVSARYIFSALHSPVWP